MKVLIDAASDMIDDGSKPIGIESVSSSFHGLKGKNKKERDVMFSIDGGLESD